MNKNRLILIFSGCLSGLMFVLVLLIGYVKVSFPYAYSTQIIKNSKKYNLDSNLVRAVINVESGYNQCATSVAGAVGLMQLMPRTAEWIATELGMENFERKMLFDESINIEMGCYYLNYLFTKYKDEHKVLFAYNAGEGVLNEYYSYEQTLVLESIQILETREYIKKVLKNKNGYEKLINILG